MHAFLRSGALACGLFLSSCASVSQLWEGEDSSAADDMQQAAVVVAQAESVALSQGKLTVDWRVDVDQRRPASPAGFSIPVLAQSTEGPVIVIGCQDKRARIYSMDGLELARIALHGASEAGALQLENGLVILGDVEGYLYALDVNAHSIVWQKQLSSLMQGHPVATDGGFLVQTTDNRLYHFSNDGKKRWSYTGTLGGLTMRAGASPVVAGDRVYAVFNSGDAVALRLDNGDMVWKRQLVLDNNAVVLSEIRVPIADPVLLAAPNTFQEDFLLIVPIYQGQLLFLSPQDGSAIHARTISLKSSPIKLDNAFYAADAHGAVYSLDAGTGQSLWKKQVSESELVGPVAFADRLWVADAQGHVFRLNQYGEVEADITLPGRIDRAPVAVRDGVLVRTSLGVLYHLH